jgi:hypothetical protein
VPNFLPTAAQKVTWLGTDDGGSEAGLTLHHHSLGPYGSHEMVQQHYILSNASNQHQFFSKMWLPNQSTKSEMLGTAQM